MKITKLGHCCLLIETKDKRILTDPGTFTIQAHEKLEGIDCILFTHEHSDHYHLDSLKVLLGKNPNALVYANTSVGTLLEESDIPHMVIHDGETMKLGEIVIRGIGTEHAILHASLPRSANTGYFIDGKCFYPGDAFIDPQERVDTLALPVSGPWMKISEAIDYALHMKPRIAFPVHDAIRFGSAHALPLRILPEHGIEFVPMAEGDTHEF